MGGSVAERRECLTGICLSVAAVMAAAAAMSTTRKNATYGRFGDQPAQPLARPVMARTFGAMFSGGETQSGSSPAIELRGVSKRFRTPTDSIFTALADVDLTVDPGQFCAVVGPSGCGKSTTLTLVSGLEPASEGEVLVHGSPVAAVGDDIGFVFQSDALLPWNTVGQPASCARRRRLVPSGHGATRFRDARSSRKAAAADAACPGAWRLLPTGGPVRRAALSIAREAAGEPG